jgi:hypothetical protein
MFPNYGEALATLLAAQLTTFLSLLNLILEGDSLIITQAFKLPTITQDWRITSTILVIHSIISHFINLAARKIN